MEAGAGAKTRPQDGAEPKPRSDGEPLPDDAPPGLEKAAGSAEQAKSVTPDEEAEALGWLLGAAEKPLEYSVELDWDTEDGIKKIPWRIRSLAGREIDRIEQENRKGDGGPFGEIDDLRASAGLVAAATVFPDLNSTEFRTPRDHPDAVDVDATDAVMRVFRFQSGLLGGLAGEIRRISGWAPNRVGQAQRKLVRAAGN